MMKPSVPLFLLAAFFLAGCPRAVPLPLVPPAELDFAGLHRDALLAQAAYEGAGQVRAALNDPAAVVHVEDVASVENLYFLAVSSGVQVVGIRGTANLKNALLDVELAETLDPDLGIRLHEGFARASRAVLDGLLPRLDKALPVRLVGHSLGGAEAVVVGMFLDRRGYRLEKIVTFGQPLVTNARGGEAFAHLPLLRVADDKDIVPFLPPLDLVPFLKSYHHFGPVLVLMEGSGFARPSSRTVDPQALKDAVEALRAGGLPPEIQEHFIATYVRRLAEKIERAQEVSR